MCKSQQDLLHIFGWIIAFSFGGKVVQHGLHCYALPPVQPLWSDWVYPRTGSDQTNWRNKEDYLDKPCNNHTEIGKKCNKITENNAIHTFNHYNSPFPCEYCMVYLRSDPCLGVYPVTCILARDIHWQGSGVLAVPSAIPVSDSPGYSALLKKARICHIIKNYDS